MNSLKLLLASSLIMLQLSGFGQMAAYIDPIQAYNKALLDTDGGKFLRVGRYNVSGSPYLLGEKNKADVFAVTEQAHNIHISYNLYTQEIEFYSSANPDKPLVKTVNEVDSFFIDPNVSEGLLQGMKFYHGKHLGSDEEKFFMLVYDGPKYSLYKSYKADLHISSTNYVDADRRDFGIEYQYHYKDKTKNEMKNLKHTQRAVSKEFAFHPETKKILEDNTFSMNPEVKLKEVFTSINQ